MSLRESLKNYIPVYLWESIEHPEGHIVTNEEYNMRWNLLMTQGDQQAYAIKDLLEMLYETVMHDSDGATHIRVSMPEYVEDNLKGVLKAIDTRLKTDASNLVTHKTSGDHDTRYYTKTLLDSGQLDGRYYTKTLLDSGQLDGRYYTKQDLVPWLRGGDTNIKEEVFIIVDPNLGDGTFTYTYRGDLYTGLLTVEGGQIFELKEGYFDTDVNRVEAIINDTLRRSVASGGLQEISGTSVALTAPEGSGAEITIKYYERIGTAAEYNIRLNESKPPANYGRTMWFEVI